MRRRRRPINQHRALIVYRPNPWQGLLDYLDEQSQKRASSVWRQGVIAAHEANVTWQRQCLLGAHRWFFPKRAQQGVEVDLQLKTVGGLSMVNLQQKADQYEQAYLNTTNGWQRWWLRLWKPTAWDLCCYYRSVESLATLKKASRYSYRGVEFDKAQQTAYWSQGYFSHRQFHQILGPNAVYQSHAGWSRSFQYHFAPAISLATRWFGVLGKRHYSEDYALHRLETLLNQSGKHFVTALRKGVIHPENYEQHLKRMSESILQNCKQRFPAHAAVIEQHYRAWEEAYKKHLELMLSRERLFLRLAGFSEHFAGLHQRLGRVKQGESLDAVYADIRKALDDYYVGLVLQSDGEEAELILAARNTYLVYQKTLWRAYVKRGGKHKPKHLLVRNSKLKDAPAIQHETLRLYLRQTFENYKRQFHRLDVVPARYLELERVLEVLTDYVNRYPSGLQDKELQALRVQLQSLAHWHSKLVDFHGLCVQELRTWKDSLLERDFFITSVSERKQLKLRRSYRELIRLSESVPRGVEGLLTDMLGLSVSHLFKTIAIKRKGIIEECVPSATHQDMADTEDLDAMTPEEALVHWKYVVLERESTLLSLEYTAAVLGVLVDLLQEMPASRGMTFEVFKCKVQPLLDDRSRLIDQLYKAYASRYHPDKWEGGSERDKAQVNEAFREVNWARERWLGLQDKLDVEESFTKSGEMEKQSTLRHYWKLFQRKDVNVIRETALRRHKPLLELLQGRIESYRMLLDSGQDVLESHQNCMKKCREHEQKRREHEQKRREHEQKRREHEQECKKIRREREVLDQRIAELELLLAQEKEAQQARRVPSSQGDSTGSAPDFNEDEMRKEGYCSVDEETTKASLANGTVPVLVVDQHSAHLNNSSRPNAPVGGAALYSPTVETLAQSAVYGASNTQLSPKLPQK